jgi:DNA-binding response OmpR family regulator
MRILLVEDGLVLSKLLSVKIPQMQLNNGVDLTAVKTLKEAKQKYRSFDAVILDLSLPDSAPENTVAWAMEAHRKVPVIILTADKHREFIRLAKLRGIGYVIKTENLDSLEVEIIGAVALAERRARRMEMIDDFLDASMGLER